MKGHTVASRGEAAYSKIARGAALDLNDIVAAYLEAVAVDDRQMVVYRAACSASMRRRKDGLHCVNYQAGQAASAVAEEHPA